MKKENQLILDLLRFSLDKKLKTKIKSSLKKELDWNYILQTSRRQLGVSPILYKTLKSINFKKKIIKEFENDYNWIYKRNMLFYKELRKILKVFEKEKIDVILLKGIYLAKYVYKDIGLRPMGDIDLLVKKKQVNKTREVLKKLNFDYKGATAHHDRYTNKKGINIEIHFEIDRQRPDLSDIDPANFFKDVQSNILNREYNLVYLCIHQNKHLKCGAGLNLKWLFDIAFLTKEENINFYKFRKLTKRMDMNNNVYFVFLLYKKILDPDFNLKNINQPSVINKKIMNYITSKMSFSNNKNNFYIKDFTNVILHDSVWKKIIMLTKKYLFPNPEELNRKFSTNIIKPFIYLFYILNPIRILIKSSIGIIRIFYSKKQKF